MFKTNMYFTAFEHDMKEARCKVMKVYIVILSDISIEEYRYSSQRVDSSGI